MIRYLGQRAVVLSALLALVPAAHAGPDQGAAELALNRGLERFMAEDYAGARRYFDSAIAQDREFAAGHYYLGLTLLQIAAQSGDEAERAALREQAVAAFEQSRLRDPQLVMAFLDAGIATAMLGRFEQAESSFQTYIAARPNDPLPYLFLAVLHYRRAETDPGAIPAAEENLSRAEAAVDRAPGVTAELRAYIKLYRALLHLRRDEPEQARAELRESAALAPDSAISERSQALLAQVEHGEKEGRRPWDLSLSAGFDYDTNVVLRGKNMPPEYDNKNHDWRFGLGSDFTYRFYESDELVLGAGVRTFNSWHTDIDEFNVQTYGANVYAGYKPGGQDWLTFGLRYDFDYTLVGNDSFLQRHRLTPQVEVAETDWTRTLLFYQFDARDYAYDILDPREDRDGDVEAVGVVQSFDVFPLFDRYVTADLRYRFENSSTEGSQYAADYHIFGMGVGVPLPWDVTFDFGAEWEQGAYRYANLLDSDYDHRHDWIQTFVFGLTKQFNENLSLQFRVDLINADSNVVDVYGREPYTYDRVVYGVNLTYRF